MEYGKYICIVKKGSNKIDHNEPYFKNYLTTMIEGMCRILGHRERHGLMNTS